jgi:multidrug efflux pump subunit AcrA (membrane-fusion protein)
MSALATPLPARRPELVIRPLGEDGTYVVKDPGTASYYHLGAEEHFLLSQLDGDKDAAAVCAAFEQRFGRPLSEEELDEFIALAREQGFLRTPAEKPSTLRSPPQRGKKTRQSILYWRKSLFDPDRFCTWLEPKIRFFWTRGFLIFSAGCILLAALLVWAGQLQLAGGFLQALRWETALWVWLTLFVVTMLHEFAHGLTCKHHGGEVHEIGLLLLFFMPCFYCNVSDAWLFKERSKRLWVTFAGGYFELFVWALAVFVWRLTLPGTFVNYLALVVLVSCGVQTLFNFNPLLKLDGYYLLSDWAAVPNLHQRAGDHTRAHVRRLLWGAGRPAREPRGRVLLAFGAVSWIYSLIFLALMLWGLFHVLGTGGGWLGAGAVVVLGLVSTRGLFRGFTNGEVRKMITMRHKRTIIWLLVLGALAAALWLVEIEDWAGGPFRLRPATHAEVRAPVAGFLREVCFDEGDRVSPGAVVARLEVPDLESRLVRKQAEVREAEARLRLLEIGTRPEEIAAQRQRVELAAAWRDLARRDLARTRQALTEDLDRLGKQVAARRGELGAAESSYQRAQDLLGRRALAEEQYRETEARYRVSRAQFAEAEAAKRVTEAKGTLEAEAELARREKELAEARTVLGLLEGGSRPEEVQAEKARLARLREEGRHLEEQRQKQTVPGPTPGVITTARLKEKVGQYLREGDLICVVEEPAGLEAEVSLAEQDVARVRPGQEVKLKARALPFEVFLTRVDRVAPAAARGDGQGSVTVYCRLDAPAGLLPDMTGHARVSTGRRPVGGILLDRALRLVRTEFWW